jgi:hypothetical protein
MDQESTHLRPLAASIFHFIIPMKAGIQTMSRQTLQAGPRILGLCSDSASGNGTASSERRRGAEYLPKF